MTQSPTVSVAIPLFNKAGYIVEAVASALSQSVRDLEVIVVNDGSTDASVTNLANVSDSRIRLIRQENSGVAVARNRAMQEARGRFVAFLDADDLWQPDHLLHLLSMANQYPEAALVGNAYVEMRQIDPIAASRAPVHYRLVDDYFSECGLAKAPLFTSSCMVLRDRAIDIGGFPVGKYCGEDIALWMKLAADWPIVASDYVGCRYRRSDGSLSTQSSYRLAPDISMAILQEFLRLRTDWPPERRYGAQEYYYRLALAHCLDCLRAGNIPEAREFLNLSQGTNAHWRRRQLAALLVHAPDPLRYFLFRLKNVLTG